MEAVSILERGLLETLSDEFSIGTIVHGEELWGDPARAQYFLETERGKFVLNVESLARSESETKQEIELLLLLRRHGFPCPELVDSRSGRSVLSHNGRRLWIYRQIGGIVLPSESLSLQQLEHVGRILAELHVIGKGFKKGIDNRFSFPRITSVYREVKKFLPPHLRSVIRVLDDEVGYLEHAVDNNVTKGIIHGSPSAEHFRFEGDRVAGLIDFEGFSRSEVIYDLATAVNALCYVQERYQLDRFESLVNGYESVRPLSLPEWDCFPNELRFSALWQTVTKVRDFFTKKSDASGRLQRDFKEYFQRLLILRRERRGGIEELLMIMATGYDYRRYQKVKSMKRGGKKQAR